MSHPIMLFFPREIHCTNNPSIHFRIHGLRRPSAQCNPSSIPALTTSGYAADVLAGSLQLPRSPICPPAVKMGAERLVLKRIMPGDHGRACIAEHGHSLTCRVQHKQRREYQATKAPVAPVQDPTGQWVGKQLEN